MTADALKQILWLYMHDSTDMDYIMSCVDEYSRSQNSGKPLVSGSLPQNSVEVHDWINDPFLDD